MTYGFEIEKEKYLFEIFQTKETELLLAVLFGTGTLLKLEDKVGSVVKYSHEERRFVYIEYYRGGKTVRLEL
jgi:hypothetical protein